MDKETLSNYGWIVICVMVLAVMIALATPFGSFIADGFKATYTGLSDTENSVLDVMIDSTGGCVHNETEFRNATTDYSGDTVCKKCGTVLENGQYSIPSGGVYTVSDGTILNGDNGDKMPVTVSDGDMYVYSDYQYTYSAVDNGWSVTRNPSVSQWKKTYGDILGIINGQPIKNMYQTFYNCSSMEIAPKIPDTVISMYETFNGCTGLLSAPEIPYGVTDMYRTFTGCKKLKEGPVLPETLVNMHLTFWSCGGLEVAPVIPNSVTNMNGAFLGCSALKTYVGSTDPDGDFSNFIIPQNVTNLHQAFQGCSLLTTAPSIPEKVEVMSMTFAYCESLVSAPTIPSSVTNLKEAFRNCTSLTGTITIDANIPNSTDNYFWCFYTVDFEAQNITLTGTCARLDSLAAYGATNYCATCNGKCNGGH